MNMVVYGHMNDIKMIYHAIQKENSAAAVTIVIL